MRGGSPRRRTCRCQEGSGILQERWESLERHVREAKAFACMGCESELKGRCSRHTVISEESG